MMLAYAKPSTPTGKELAELAGEEGLHMGRVNQAVDVIEPVTKVP